MFNGLREAIMDSIMAGGNQMNTTANLSLNYAGVQTDLSEAWIGNPTDEQTMNAEGKLDNKVAGFPGPIDGTKYTISEIQAMILFYANKIANTKDKEEISQLTAANGVWSNMLGVSNNYKDLEMQPIQTSSSGLTSELQNTQSSQQSQANTLSGILSQLCGSTAQLIQSA